MILIPRFNLLAVRGDNKNYVKYELNFTYGIMLMRGGVISKTAKLRDVHLVQVLVRSSLIVSTKLKEVHLYILGLVWVVLDSEDQDELKPKKEGIRLCYQTSYILLCCYVYFMLACSGQIMMVKVVNFFVKLCNVILDWRLRNYLVVIIMIVLLMLLIHAYLYIVKFKIRICTIVEL